MAEKLGYARADKPTVEPAVYNSDDDAKKALQNGQIDGLVVELPTAFYITGAELTDTKIGRRGTTSLTSRDRAGRDTRCQ
ncbi:hypothetical protein C5N14_25970 [Micromonospora sp. MW-13]|nr:hypothetical protein C5N14_25970 [Micromonospora sp. MW-13]